jgi:hypothetical protein
MAEPALSYEFEDKSGYLACTVRGHWQLQGVLELIGVVARECLARGHSRLACDIRPIEGAIPEMDRYWSGKRVGELMTGIRILCLGRPDQINQFGIDAARNRGAVLFATSDDREGLEWLLSDQAA